MSGIDEEEDEADGSALVRLNWGGELRRFRLGLREIRRLQKVTGFGVEMLLRRLSGGEWLIDEPAQILRLALEGAGEDEKECASLVETYYHERPKNRSVPVCMKILGAVLIGPKHDEIAARPRGGADEDEGESDPAGRLKFSDIYGAGAAMGMTPEQVDAMSMWEFRAALEGWKHAHAAESDEPPPVSEQRYRELMGQGEEP